MRSTHTTTSETARDWTCKGGRANSSEAFERCVERVTDLIAGHRIGDDPRSTARVIMAHLAHLHKLAPKE